MIHKELEAIKKGQHSIFLFALRTTAMRVRMVGSHWKLSNNNSIMIYDTKILSLPYKNIKINRINILNLLDLQNLFSHDRSFLDFLLDLH